jgi:hypothetical protein
MHIVIPAQCHRHSSASLYFVTIFTHPLKRVMLVVPLLNSSIFILLWRSSCVSDLAQTDSIFHRYGNSDTDFKTR